MEKKKYTQKQIKELKSNPYTFKVNENRIFFTKEFKKAFWIKYQGGMAPRKILEELDYDNKDFTQGQVDNIVQRVKKEAMTGEFTEGQSRNQRMKIKEPNDLENKDPALIRMNHELEYLKQEVDFLKKVLKKEKDP